MLSAQLPGTLALLVVLVLAWAIGAIFTPQREHSGVLALSVADAILRHIRPWIYVTAGFYHPHIIQLVFVLPIAFGLAKRVEPDIGAANLFKMLLFANTLSSLVIFIDMFSLFIIFRHPLYLRTSMSGFYGGITALLVALMKPSPNATAPFIPGLKLRFYPLASSICFSALTCIGLVSSSVSVRYALVGAGPFSVLGGFFGWYYLRFLSKNRDHSQGDVSDDFELVSLLPDYCAPIVGPVANFCFNVVKLCGYFKKRPTHAPRMLPVLAEIKNDPIAERRKARAMKALDEKLAKLANARDDGDGTSSSSASLLAAEIRDEE